MAVDSGSGIVICSKLLRETSAAVALASCGSFGGRRQLGPKRSVRMFAAE